MKILCVDDHPIALRGLVKDVCDIVPEAEVYNFGIRKLYPRANIIFVTVYSENEHAAAVLRLHPSGYLTKPATKEQLKKELNDLRYEVPDMDLPENAVFG